MKASLEADPHIGEELNAAPALLEIAARELGPRGLFWPIATVRIVRHRLSKVRGGGAAG